MPDDEDVRLLLIAMQNAQLRAMGCIPGCWMRAMLLAHKIALDPNAAQRLYFARAAGTGRLAAGGRNMRCAVNTAAGRFRPRCRCAAN
jgi:hypothetical protein